MQADRDATWASPGGWKSHRCAGCGGVLEFTRLWRQPKAEDHESGCKQYILAVRVGRYAADLAQATSEPKDRAADSDDLSWRRYCHDAACDFERAAEEESVSDALKQHEDQYVADTQSDGTEGSTGRAAAAKMLMLACQALSAGKNPASVAARIPR